MTIDGPTNPNSIAGQLNEINWDFSGYIPYLQGHSIHNIHWYPAPFPSALPGTLIDILGKDSTVFLDPFCGTGTAPIEAWFRGKQAIGIDSNTFAVEIARAKVQLVSQGRSDIGDNLAEEYSSFRKSFIKSYNSLSPEAICEHARMHEECYRWFIKNVLAEIAICKNWILDSSGLVEKWRIVLTLALSSLLHKQLSVARKYHYTYIVDNSRLKEYAYDDIDVERIFVDKLKSDFIKGQLTREEGKFDINLYPLFQEGCAQNIERIINTEVDLVVTSPPYFGMNDYVRSQYLSWLVFNWDNYNKDIQMESGSRRRRTSQKKLDAYIQDLASSFSGLFNIMRRGGYLAIVLGHSNSALASQYNLINMIQEMFIKKGFNFIWSGNRRVKFRKINNISYRSESLWVFQR